MTLHRAPLTLVAGAALALLLTGCAGEAGTGASDASSQQPSASTPTDSPTPAPSSESPVPEVVAAACEDAITVGLDRENGSGRGGFFVLTNTGSASCSLVGYVDPAALDSSGAPVTTVDHSDLNDLEGVPVELAPGASAYSWVFWDDTADTLDACTDPVDADTIAVTIPGASAAQRVETSPLPLCGGRGTILHLGPIDSEQRTASMGY